MKYWEGIIHLTLLGDYENSSPGVWTRSHKESTIGVLVEVHLHFDQRFFFGKDLANPKIFFCIFSPPR